VDQHGQSYTCVRFDPLGFVRWGGSVFCEVENNFLNKGEGKGNVYPRTGHESPKVG